MWCAAAASIEIFALRICKFLPLQLHYWALDSVPGRMPAFWAWAVCPAWADRAPAMAAIRKPARAIIWMCLLAVIWADGAVVRFYISYLVITSPKRAVSKPN